MRLGVENDGPRRFGHVAARVKKTIRKGFAGQVQLRDLLHGEAISVLEELVLHHDRDTADGDVNADLQHGET